METRPGFIEKQMIVDTEERSGKMEMNSWALNHSEPEGQSKGNLLAIDSVSPDHGLAAGLRCTWIKPYTDRSLRNAPHNQLIHLFQPSLMPKLNSPLPQPLPKECAKAEKICMCTLTRNKSTSQLTLFQVASFVDSRHNGLDGVIPRSILSQAKGFAIFTIFKAGFIFSARAGSGVVIARLQDGCMFSIFLVSRRNCNSYNTAWSAPSAIGTAGLGVGTQAGAEMTDFLVVLNSRSVRDFPSTMLLFL